MTSQYSKRLYINWKAYLVDNQGERDRGKIRRLKTGIINDGVNPYLVRFYSKKGGGKYCDDP